VDAAHGTDGGVVACTTQKRMMVSKETMQGLQLCTSGGEFATTTCQNPKHRALKAFGYVLGPLQPLTCGPSFSFENPKRSLSGLTNPSHTCAAR
jgi:hypothetical protein